MNDLVLLEMAADEHWQSLSQDEQLAYLIANPNSRFLTKEVADSWFDRLSPFKKKEYLEEHPNSSFAEHLRSLPRNIQSSFHNLSENSKQAIQDWHEKTATQRAADTAKALYHAGKRVIHHTGEYGKHEYHMYKGAAAALNHFAHGKSWNELSPHHKKALREALIHGGITAGSLMLGDATGGSGLSAIGHLAGAFATEHVNHAAMLGGAEVLYNSGKDALKKATAPMNKPPVIPENRETAMDKKLPPNLEKEVKKITDLLIKANVPTHEWIHVLSEIEKRSKSKNNQLN